MRLKAMIMGCGFVGIRIATAEKRQDGDVQCWTRSQIRCDTLTNAGFTSQCCDLDRSVSTLPASHIDVLYYLVPPPGKGQDDPRSRAAQKLFERVSVGRIVLISATGVYGDCGGRWIDEQQPLNPTVDRSLRRVAAENIWCEWATSRNTPLTVLRVAGIYAADRLPEKRLRQQVPVLAINESPFSNRIHVDDLVAVCLAAARTEKDDVYNVSDDEPTTMTDYFLRVADALGISRPSQISLADARLQFSAGMLSYLNESRRIDNRKMKDELGVILRYPTLLEGLRAVVRSRAV